MKSVFLSPHFPPSFANFAGRLKEQGVAVLGLADQPYDDLSPELKRSLTEYYRVSDMHNYEELVRAMGYFTHRYGKIDHIDSHNEYWLETEARLRTDFNIAGIKCGQIENIKCKSKMKEVFRNAGLSPARGRICRSDEELRSFIKEVGLPVVAKPDNGVGAAATFKIEGEADIQRFWTEKAYCDYIVEEFISGDIVTFDGLVDQRGELVFSTSLRYCRGIMEIVNEDSDVYYWTVRSIEPDLEQVGLSTLKAFDVKARFFHLEFFRTGDGKLMPLEVNMRPPGGLTLDMINYVFDFDCYRAWAEMLVHGHNPRVMERPYFVIYVGRKDWIPSVLHHDQVLHQFAPLLKQEERMAGVFARAIGNHGYILRHEELEPLLAAAASILQRA